MKRLIAVILFFVISLSSMYALVGAIYWWASAPSMQAAPVEMPMRIARDDETLWI